MAKREQYYFVCTNARPDGNSRPSCGRSGSAEVLAALKAELVHRGLAKSVARVCASSCLDMCDHGPVIAVQPQNAFALHMTPGRVPELVRAVLDGTFVDDDAARLSTPVDSTDRDR